MRRRHLLTMLPLALVASVRIDAQRGGARRAVTVYKDPSCGCCTQWAELLRQGGFIVTIKSITEMDTSKYAVPSTLRSCHTAVIDGHIVEGHVPVADIERMLTQGAAIAGLAVPGMPIGSPGMEVQGVAAQPFDVVAFDRAFKTRVFASYHRA